MSQDQIRTFLQNISFVKDSQGLIKLHLAPEAVLAMVQNILGSNSPEASAWEAHCLKMKEAADRVQAANQAWDDWRDSLIGPKAKKN